MDEEFAGITMNHIGRTAPVSPAEERRLVQVMAAGRDAEAELARNPNLNGSRQRLVEEAEAGREARRLLIEANGRLVISVAARYNRNQTHIPLTELCQEGVLGLIKGIDKFDPARGTKLSTYATWWIRQAIGRYVNQNRTIRLPVHQVDRVYRIRRGRATLMAQTGKPPTDEEVARFTGETIENIKLLAKYESNPTSLDEPVGEDQFSRYDILPDDGPLPTTVAENQMGYQKVTQLLDLLDAREARILTMRFGLQNGKTMTLKEIAARYGLTRERIRQIESDALTKLRNRVPPEMRMLLTGGH